MVDKFKIIDDKKYMWDGKTYEDDRCVKRR